MPTLAAIELQVSPIWTVYWYEQFGIITFAALSKQISWPGCKAVQSKPGLYENIEPNAIFVFNEIVSQVSPATIVYLFAHWTIGYGVNPCLAKHNCWPGWRAEQVIGFILII